MGRRKGVSVTSSNSERPKTGLSVRAKCRLVELLGLLVAIPGIFLLVYEGVSDWFFPIIFFTFWFSGACFVVAMIGDGKEGLGIKRPPDNVRG
jgi:hypothetical protein